jgi:uncharacterized protein (TIGR04222 family)
MAMDHPWGLSGPAFLWLYGVVFLRWSVRRPRLAEPVPVGDADVVAHLTGGPARVVETSLARLVEQGVVRVTRTGMITRTTATVADPLDQAVLDQLGGRTRRVAELVTRAKGSRPVIDLAESVVARGLVVPLAKVRRAKRRGLVAVWLLLAVGVVRVVTGLAGRYPVGYLLMELMATLVVVVALHAWRVTGDSVHGTRVLEAARTADDTATAVALDGLGAYPDKTLASAMLSTRYGEHSPRSSSRARTGAAAASGGYGGAAVSCGGGSSSGGSSCGGGGGGCGGGGA